MTQVTSVTAKGFKGLSFDQEFGEKTLIIGPNGSGKSSRVLALMLSTRGYVPGVGKTNPDIVDAFCPGEELTVGHSVKGGIFLERVYTQKKGGTISQTYRVNGTKAGKDDYLRKIGEAGVIRPVDVAAFMALSDAQKLSALFDLYPPDGDIGDLTAKIEKSKENYLHQEKKARDAKASKATLISSLSEKEAPAGTLAETRGEIEEREKELEAARKELANIEAQDRERERQEQEKKTKEEEAEKTETATLPLSAPPAGGDDDVPESVVTPPPPSGGTAGPLSWTPDEGTSATKMPPRTTVTMPPGGPLGVAHEEVCAMLEKIISTMDAAGCNACAARLVAVGELKKLKGGNGNGR